jgi:hypothetical protein
MNTNNQRASIDRIRQHLQSYIDSRNTPVASTVESTATLDNKTDVKKEYRGNQYELDQFIYRQSQIKYFASIAKNKKHEVVRNHKEFDSEAFERTRYLKKWHRVDEFAKQVVIKKYLDELVVRELISAEQKKMLLQQALDLVREKQLKKVDYDETAGVLYEIKQLDLPSTR